MVRLLKKKKFSFRFVIYTLTVIFACILIMCVIIEKKFKKSKNFKGTVGSIAAVRSNINLYYSDNNGVYPEGDPMDVLVPRYIEERPLCELPGHDDSSEEFIVIDYLGNKKPEDFFKDTGKWLYINDKESDHWGEVYIDCTHTDKAGRRYCDY